MKEVSDPNGVRMDSLLKDLAPGTRIEIDCFAFVGAECVRDAQPGSKRIQAAFLAELQAL